MLLARADHVYLSDFGLAKRSEEPGGLTRQGSIVARAEYLAPEQIIEDRVDALTDVYALGCLLFESLTGEAPFAASAEGPAMLAHVNSPPPSPLERRPDLPPEFDEVVRRAMAKEPSRALPVGGRPRRGGPGRGGRPATDGRGVHRGHRRGLAAGHAGAVEGAALGSPGGVGGPARRARANKLQWGFALGVLVVLFLCMISALNALSSL